MSFDSACPRWSVPPARALRSSRSSHLSAFSCSVSTRRGLSISRNVSGERFCDTAEGGADADADTGGGGWGDVADVAEGCREAV